MIPFLVETSYPFASEMSFEEYRGKKKIKKNALNQEGSTLQMAGFVSCALETLLHFSSSCSDRLTGYKGHVIE